MSLADEKNEKYEELMKRDKEMQDFLDDFENNKQQLAATKQQMEQEISTILERYHQYTELLGQREISAESLEGAQGEWERTEMEIKSGKLTLDQIVAGKEMTTHDSPYLAERAKCLHELERITQTENKMQQEVQALVAKMTQLKEETRRVSNVDALKREAQFHKQVLVCWKAPL